MNPKPIVDPMPFPGSLSLSFAFFKESNYVRR
jgi:hypothetical protein